MLKTLKIFILTAILSLFAFTYSYALDANISNNSLTNNTRKFI